MDRHAYVRGEIIKYREDFEKGIMWLADWVPDVADTIRKGSIRAWVMLLEHKIDDLARINKPGNNITDE